MEFLILLVLCLRALIHTSKHRPIKYHGPEWTGKSGNFGLSNDTLVLALEFFCQITLIADSRDGRSLLVHKISYLRGFLKLRFRFV